jgi:hypothetical protein
MDEAQEHFGSFGSVVSVDNPVSNRKTREVLGWEPHATSLLIFKMENTSRHDRVDKL